MSKILIVEDNEMNRDMLSRRLMRKGFDVIMAEDGQKGVDMSKSDNPDLILMDLSLQIMDGWQATSTIKADPETNSFPLLFLLRMQWQVTEKKHLMQLLMNTTLNL